MKEYEFVRVELSTMRRRPKEDYQQIIHDYAKRGWRFVQIFAPSIDGYGAAAYFEIIFERDAEKASFPRRRNQWVIIIHNPVQTQRAISLYLIAKR